MAIKTIKSENKSNLESAKISLADFLKEKRKSRGLSLEQLSDLTKIQVYHLNAMENGNFDNLPPTVYRAGIFKRLSKFIGADADEIMEMYGKEAGESSNPDYTNDVVLPKFFFYFTLTPKKITIFFGSLLLIGLLVYLWHQLNFLTGPPTLVIEPRENIAVQSESISVKGRTDSGINLEINGENVYVDFNGSFSKDVRLAAGLNTIEVVAVNKFGKSTKILRQIFRENIQ